MLVTRSFNHVGPRQGDRCSIQTFCQQMALIEAGRQPPILEVQTLRPAAILRMWPMWPARCGCCSATVPLHGLQLCWGAATRIGAIVDLVRARGRVPVDVQVDRAAAPIRRGDSAG